jgi:hypothetical protein
MTMTKKIFYSLLLIALLPTLWSCAPRENVCTSEGYTLYKPVFFKHTVTSEDIYYTNEDRVGPNHDEHIQFVFDYYKIKYKVQDEHIMVDCAVWDDKDYMWNLTRKAEDKLWRETR